VKLLCKNLSEKKDKILIAHRKFIQNKIGSPVGPFFEIQPVGPFLTTSSTIIKVPVVEPFSFDHPVGRF